MTPQEFDRACATHDWTYNYSDDHSMWKLGEQQAQVLQWAMQEDNRLIQLYRLWSAYQFSGPAWNKPVPDVVGGTGGEPPSCGRILIPLHAWG